MLPLFSNTTL